MALSIREYLQVFISGSADIYFTIPASVQAGDVMIIQLTSRYSIKVPQGWTTDFKSGAGAINGAVISKVASTGDAGTTVVIEWGFIGSSSVLHFIAVAGSYGIRATQGHLIQDPGGVGTPSAVSAVTGDLALYLGGTRYNGGGPTLSRGTVDATGYDGTAYGGTIGHELLVADDGALTCTFTAPLSTNGIQYSVIVLASTVIPTSIRMSRMSVEVLSASSSNAQMSRMSIEVLSSGPSSATLSRSSVEVLMPTQSRYRGWGTEK